MPEKLPDPPPQQNTSDTLPPVKDYLQTVEDFIAANPLPAFKGQTSRSKSTAPDARNTTAHSHPNLQVPSIGSRDGNEASVSITKLDDRFGEAAPIGLSFAPLLAVAKFPYKFVAKRFLQPVATAFFDQEKIWAREWDL